VHEKVFQAAFDVPT